MLDLKWMICSLPLAFVVVSIYRKFFSHYKKHLNVTLLFLLFLSAISFHFQGPDMVKNIEMLIFLTSLLVLFETNPLGNSLKNKILGRPDQK